MDARTALSGKRAVIVEDGALTAMSLGQALAGAGLTVTGTAWSGAEAVPVILRDRPEIIILDINLRGSMNGIEVLRQVLGEYDACVVIVSAYPEYEEAAMKAGACGYVLKPVTGTALLHKLTQGWEKFQSRQAA